MPRFLEDKLKKEYGAASAIPYKVMNSIGAIAGNKETPLGKRMEDKHQADAHRKNRKQYKANRQGGHGSSGRDGY